MSSGFHTRQINLRNVCLCKHDVCTNFGHTFQQLVPNFSSLILSKYIQYTFYKNKSDTDDTWAAVVIACLTEKIAEGVDEGMAEEER